MNGTSQKQQIFQDLKRFILSKASIVYLLSDEEDRVETLFKELVATFQPKPKLYVWNPFHGLVGENEKIENSSNPLDALEKVIQRQEQAFYLFEGLLDTYSGTIRAVERHRFNDISNGQYPRFNKYFIT